MNNHEIQAAWKYHDGTKHSYWSVRDHPHFLDWALPFKIYPKIEPLPLPRDVPQTGVATLSAISEPVPSSRADSVPGVQVLARLSIFRQGLCAIGVFLMFTRGYDRKDEVAGILGERVEMFPQDSAHAARISTSGRGSFLGQPIQQGIVDESRYGDGRELMRMTPKIEGVSAEPLPMKGGLRWNRNLSGQSWSIWWQTPVTVSTNPP